MPKPVSDLETHIGFWLRFVSNHVSHAFAAKLAESGVTVAEWVLLREMFGREDLTVSVLARQTGMTKGGISKLVDRLAAKGLAGRQDREDDLRVQDLALTAQARQLVPRLAKIADRNDLEFFAPLKPEERDALMTILRKLVREHGLKKIPTE